MLSFTISPSYRHIRIPGKLAGFLVAAFGHDFIFSGFLGTDDIGLSNTLALHSFSAVQKPSFYRHTPKRYLLSEARSAVGYGHPDIPDVQAWI